jgi:hypothetical protein
MSQELPGFMKDHKASGHEFDILNFGNLLNKKWGRIDEIGFPSATAASSTTSRPGRQRQVRLQPGQRGRPSRTRQDKGESQWACSSRCATSSDQQ